jgi:flagellin FlaB
VVGVVGVEKKFRKDHIVECQKCGYKWHTRSKLKLVTCPSCNQKTPNIPLRRLIKQFVKSTRAIVGLEAAIVLIAFVIIAAAFSFMVINQGLFATERGKTVIQEGLKQASTPLTVDGTIFVRTTHDGTRVNVFIIPLKAFGVKYVAMAPDQTVITLRIGQKAWANAYLGLLYLGYNNGTTVDQGWYNATGITYDPTGKMFDDFVGFRYANITFEGEPCSRYINGTYVNAIQGDKPGLNPHDFFTGAVLAIANSNGDEALDTNEKGFLIITLASEDAVPARAKINIEIRLEKSATLSIEFAIPESMPADTYTPV